MIADHCENYKAHLLESTPLSLFAISAIIPIRYMWSVDGKDNMELVRMRIRLVHTSIKDLRHLVATEGTMTPDVQNKSRGFNFRRELRHSKDDKAVPEVVLHFPEKNMREGTKHSVLLPKNQYNLYPDKRQTSTGRMRQML